MTTMKTWYLASESVEMIVGGVRRRMVLKVISQALGLAGPGTVVLVPADMRTGNQRAGLETIPQHLRLWMTSLVLEVADLAEMEALAEVV